MVNVFFIRLSWLVLSLWLLAFGGLRNAKAQQSIAEIRQEINTYFPSNTTRAIVASRLRETFNDILDNIPQAQNSIAIRSVAQVRAMTSVTAAPYLISISDEGKEGLFYWAQGDTTTTDNLGTCLVDAFGRRFKRYISGSKIHASWFLSGTNYQAAIESAKNYLSAGQTLYLDNRSWTITSTVTIHKNFVTIEGEGTYVNINISPTTTLSKAFDLKGFDIRISKLQFTCNANVRDVLQFNGNGSRVTVTDCYFVGHSTKPNGQNAIHANASVTPAVYLASFRSCHFNYFDKCIWLENETNGHYYDLNMDRPKWGIYASSIGGLSEFGLTFIQTPDSAGVYSNNNANIYSVKVESVSPVPAIKFGPSASYNTVTMVLQTGSGPYTTDAGIQNLGFHGRGYRALYFMPIPTYDIYVEEGSIFSDLGNANKLTKKKAGGNIVLE